VRNAEIAEAFEELASLYELDDAVVHRVQAYRTAAKRIREAGVSVAELAEQGRAEQLPGIGKTIAEKIDALVEGGSIPSADKLKQRIPAGLVLVTRLPGLGPKRARQLHEHLGVGSIADLREAVEQGRIADVPGFGPKAEAAIRAALEAGADGAPRPRTLLSKALPVGEAIVAALREHPAAARVELAGSARRLADSCKDLDVVAAASDPAALVEGFAALGEIDVVHSTAAAGARATTHSGLAVDLRIVPEETFGNLLQHFTGSGRHNEALRTDAVRRGLHVSEYGVKYDATGETHRCSSDDDVYRLLGMDPIPPELREDRGELEAARRGELPALVELSDVRGDLHCHTLASDGRNTAREMAERAHEHGLDYLAITDHSASHGFGNDVQPDELRRQIELIARLRGELDGLTLLAGSEVNIHPDGSLDYDDGLLDQLDWVIASVHTSFRIGSSEMTARVVHAIEHPLVDAIGHPTGRLIERRRPYPFDFDAVLAAAASSGTFLEINGNPDRRDINDVLARAAAEAGVPVLLSSDAHGVERLANLRWAVATARRAWLTPDAVANARPWAELDALRKRSRRLA
jgi:DNA polymerase (family X)